MKIQFSFANEIFVKVFDIQTSRATSLNSYGKNFLPFIHHIAFKPYFAAG